MRRLSFMVLCAAALAFGCGNGDDGTGGTGGTGGSGGTGGGGQGGAMETSIHGCTPSAAMDMTGMANVTISDISAWAVPHKACIRVSEGTQVTWEGDFTAHPLVGGISPTKEDNSIITLAGFDSGAGPADITFPDAGTYPYFCDVHRATMQGVIYVVP